MPRSLAILHTHHSTLFCLFGHNNLNNRLTGSRVCLSALIGLHMQTEMSPRVLYRRFFPSDSQDYVYYLIC